MQWNNDISATTLLSAASEAIRKRLPPEWSLCVHDLEEIRWSGGTRFDATFGIRDSQGSSAVIMVEVKGRPIETRQVISMLDNWRRMLLAHGEEITEGESNYAFMVVAPYVGPSARDRLSEAGVSFADSTGNIRFAVNRPAVFIEAQGAARNPWRENAPLRSLKRRRTARVVRGFLDYRPPFGTRELASETKSSAASVSRVSELLEREAIIERETPRGRILSVDWERLVRRWADDYSFLDANGMTPWLEPRGIRTLFDRLREAEFAYAVTGSFAAVRFAPAAEPRLAAIYAANPEDAADRLGLRRAETGGNVLIGRPFDPVAFDRTEFTEGITYVRITQALADLMTGPGRGPSEAESLVDWMRSNEETWRLQLTRTT